jgi:hypothetical protein
MDVTLKKVEESLPGGLQIGVADQGRCGACVSATTKVIGDVAHVYSIGRRPSHQLQVLTQVNQQKQTSRIV